MSLICLRTLAQLEVKCCLDILNEVSRGSMIVRYTSIPIPKQLWSLSLGVV